MTAVFGPSFPPAHYFSPRSLRGEVWSGPSAACHAPSVLRPSFGGGPSKNYTMVDILSRKDNYRASIRPARGGGHMLPLSRAPCGDVQEPRLREPAWVHRPPPSTPLMWMLDMPSGLFALVDLPPDQL